MRTALSIAAVFLSANAASADWQYTRWGQSPEELLAITDKGIRKTTEQEAVADDVYGNPLAAAEYSLQGTTADTRFFFRSNKLYGVALVFGFSHDPEYILSLLEAQYGFPGVTDRLAGDGCDTIMKKWRDEARGNIIRFDGRDCKDGKITGAEVYYSPILSAEDTGL